MASATIDGRDSIGQTERTRPPVSIYFDSLAADSVKVCHRQPPGAALSGLDGNEHGRNSG